jgi:hypothetical protein
VKYQQSDRTNSKEIGADGRKGFNQCERFKHDMEHE